MLPEEDEEDEDEDEDDDEYTLLITVLPLTTDEKENGYNEVTEPVNAG